MILVGCSGPKLSAPAEARDLYTSALFRKCRAYAERSGSSWLILSALYGVVEPDRVIAPYEYRLPRGASAWGERVGLALRGVRGPLIALCGRDYVDPWRKLVRAQVSEPMAGLGLGRRLQWLDEQNGGGR